MKMIKKNGKWRPFTKARKFAHSLKLSSQKEWYQYCRGELKGYPPKPEDIPKAPQNMYKGKGWQDTSDWLGNGKIHLPFIEARKFVRSLKLSSQKEWYQYCKGELKGYPPKPKNISASPMRVYKGKDWQGMPDWLGNGRIAFIEARKFARSLKLSSQKEWYQYCKGELKGYPPKPKNIPASPIGVYKGKGWQGYPDWLGNGRISYQKGGHLPFIEARSFVRSLKLSSQKEWYQYCKGELKGHSPKPKNIPASPIGVYKGKGWQGMPDWLGNGRISFIEARKFARSLKLSSQKEWYQYCKRRAKGLSP